MNKSGMNCVQRNEVHCTRSLFEREMVQFNDRENRMNNIRRTEFPSTIVLNLRVQPDREFPFYGEIIELIQRERCTCIKTLGGVQTTKYRLADIQTLLNRLGNASDFVSDELIALSDSQFVYFRLNGVRRFNL